MDTETALGADRAAAAESSSAATRGTVARGARVAEPVVRAARVVEPVVRELPRELTPMRALAAAERLPHTIFLESGGPAVAGSEWTMLAFDPLWRLELRDGRLWRVEGSGVHAIAADAPAVQHPSRETPLSGNALAALAAAWPERIALDPAPPVPFASGLAGYLAYDFKDLLERYPRRARREIDFPDLSLGFYDVVWAWRRATGEGWVVSTGISDLDPEDRAARDGAAWERAVRDQMARARARLEEQWRRIEAAPAEASRRVAPAEASRRVVSAEPLRPASASGAARLAGGPARPAISSNFTRDEYLRMVERALGHIAAGDVYQVNLAQRFRVEPASPLPEIYRSLREAAPAPFLAYLSLPGGGIASSSPERFFRIEGTRIETWPIKGTRPRGGTLEEDGELAGALRRSEKDRAENVMIVDLERNDLGRVCEIGSISVPALCEVVSHTNVHHLVSRVEGLLRDDVRPVDVFRAMFPGGSITGTPKIRAVEIIDSFEPVRRGVYTGAIGYWDVGGDCDWNIAIRTVVASGGAASFHVGGGIVTDSTPESEYEETLVKASGMMRALGVEWEG
jgi:para-aminobenzoate synthetase component 1